MGGAAAVVGAVDVAAVIALGSAAGEQESATHANAIVTLATRTVAFMGADFTRSP